MFKSALKRAVNAFGFDIVRKTKVARPAGPANPYSPIVLSYGNVVDLSAVSHIAERIPGMITPHAGRYMFLLCCFQQELGDVVEIGSWQGRSSAFLAHATQASGNGKFFAIDHFRGNSGKEDLYIAGAKDLSDLRAGFDRNMSHAGLEKVVTLLDMPSTEAANTLSSSKIRFLFIDGDHTAAGIERDISLFFPMLVDGALVIFDDFSNNFPSVVNAVDRVLNTNKHSRVATYKNTLVLKYRS